MGVISVCSVDLSSICHWVPLKVLTKVTPTLLNRITLAVISVTTKFLIDVKYYNKYFYIVTNLMYSSRTLFSPVFF